MQPHDGRTGLGDAQHTHTSMKLITRRMGQGTATQVGSGRRTHKARTSADRPVVDLPRLVAASAELRGRHAATHTIIGNETEPLKCARKEGYESARQFGVAGTRQSRRADTSKSKSKSRKRTCAAANTSGQRCCSPPRPAATLLTGKKNGAAMSGAQTHGADARDEQKSAVETNHQPRRGEHTRRRRQQTTTTNRRLPKGEPQEAELG